VASESPSLAVAETETLSAAEPLKALAGFFVSGVLLAFLGAILPSWGHHLQSDYWMIGLYFVALILGVLLSVRTAPWLMRKRGLACTLTFACALASIALLTQNGVMPPMSRNARHG